MELEQNYRQAQQTLHQKEARCSAEQKARTVLEPRLKAAESRIVELEASSLLNFDKTYTAQETLVWNLHKEDSEEDVLLGSASVLGAFDKMTV